jgi:hypothetical protein
LQKPPWERAIIGTKEISVKKELDKNRAAVEKKQLVFTSHRLLKLVHGGGPLELTALDCRKPPGSGRWQ